MSGFRSSPPARSRGPGRCRPVRLLLVGLAITLAIGCRRKAPEPSVTEFTETFDRSELGSDWRDTGGHYRVEKGQLVASQARHHPLWLRRPLPPDAAIEFDAWTNSPQGDIRVVLYGDGESANPAGEGCQSTGYALVFGGWGNKLSVICRGADAQGGHVRARSDWPVVPGRQYHFYINRKGGVLSWSISGHEMMEWTDPAPLRGPGHTAFGFDGGDNEVIFDNLTITPLGS
jgi:hypothetical protein